MLNLKSALQFTFCAHKHTLTIYYVSLFLQQSNCTKAYLIKNVDGLRVALATDASLDQIQNHDIFYDSIYF